MVVARLLAASAAIAVAAAQYTPDWASIDSRPLPAWYDQAKFGIFIHWGVFSVPSWGTESGGASGEWFWWNWKGSNDPNYVGFVNATEAPGWSYPDYAPQFTAELWQPDQWASLFQKSGAKYVVLTSKHHEGWCNWPSATSFNWNSMDNGPHRDLVGDLATAVRAQNLTFGLYHSMFEWFNPLYLQDKANNFQTQTFSLGKTIPELVDIVNRYQPDVIWSDGDWEAPASYWNSTEFLAWLYNDSPVKDTVVVNDRFGSGVACHHGGYFTCTDRFQPGSLQNHKWENALTVDQFSWGYRRNALPADYLSVDYFVDELVETVACGGNMLLNVGPSHDGTLDAVFADRLLGIGAWLDVNGEAIYNSVPWRAQNDTAAATWYTQSADGSSVYAIFLTWPTTPTLTLTVPVGAAGATTVSFLGLPAAGNLAWSPLAGAGQPGMVVTLPAVTPATVPCDNAWTLVLKGAK